MSKIQYKHLDLDGASLIQRRHKRQVVPPGMFAVTNMYLARSDSTLTLRPDFVMSDERVYAISEAATLQESGYVPDILNTASGIYGSERMLYITSYIPWTFVDGIPSAAMTSFSTGTATAASGSSTVAFAGLGGAVDLDQKTWRGALLEIKGDGHYYVVDKVIAADGAGTGTVQLAAPTVHDYSGDTYELFYNHNCYRAAFNKAEVQQNGAYLIYGTPDVSSQISAEDISGPFYGVISETGWEYGGVGHFQSTGDIDNGSNNGLQEQYTLATNGAKWVKLVYSPGARKEDYWETSNINRDESWTSIALGDAFYGAPRSVVRDSTLGIVVADAIATADSAGETNSNYISWNDDTSLPLANWVNRQIEDVGDDPLYPSPYAVQSMVSNGTTMTAVMWNSADDAIKLVYADGPTYTPWADCTTDNSFTGTEAAKVKLVDGNFVVCGGLGKIYVSTDGKDFAELDVHATLGGMDNIVDIAYNGQDGGSKSFVLVSSTGHIANCATVGGTYDDRTPDLPANVGGIVTNFVFYDPRGHTMMMPTTSFLLTSADYGVTWTYTSISSYGLGHAWEPTNLDYSGMDIATFFDTGYGNADNAITWLTFNRTYIATFEAAASFQPVSETYRANSVSVLDGYTVLVGTREFATGEWTYYPRMTRWSVAGSPVDFAGTGSGSGELRGNGALLRSVPVNGRIVIFETVSVGALVPRGDSDDPWDYDIIDDNFSFLSNPVVVGGQCYIVGTDGLLYSTDGIGPMTEIGASFDLTEYDDFDKLKPAWLIYSTELDSILCYYRDIAGTSHLASVVSVATGGVSEFTLPHLDDSDDFLVEVPGSIVATEGSALEQTYVSYGPPSDDTGSCQLGVLSSGKKIAGTDIINDVAAANQTAKWSATIESGELYVTQEGEKSSIKHLIVETYTEAALGANSDTPYLVAEVKSIEDSDYATSGSAETATMTTSACSGTTGFGGTAWSNLIAGPNAGSTGQKCNGTLDYFTLPCSGHAARVYLDTTLQVEGTDYTVGSGFSEAIITFTTPPAATKTLYAYWENYPEIKVKVGDFFKSSQGFHRITAIGSITDITLDHYLSTGSTSESVTHYPAWQMDDGHGRIELGINRLVEGVQIRLYLIPDYDGTQQSTIAKITGLSIGYVPQGRKLVKATGS